MWCLKICLCGIWQLGIAWVDNINGTFIIVQIYLSKFPNVFVKISKCAVFKYLSAWHLATWVDNITGTSLRDTCTSPPLSPHHCSNIQLVTKVSPSQCKLSPSQCKLFQDFFYTLSLMSFAQTRRFVWEKRCQATDSNLEFLRIRCPGVPWTRSIFWNNVFLHRLPPY